MRLSTQQVGLVKLMLRSQSDKDGWRRVSKLLWPHVKNALPADLVEVSADDDGVRGRIRFTERWQAVADYL